MRMPLKIHTLVILIISISIIGSLIVFTISQQSSEFLEIQVIEQNVNSSIIPEPLPTLTIDNTTIVFPEYTILDDTPPENSMEINNHSLNTTQGTLAPENVPKPDMLPFYFTPVIYL